MGTEPLRLWRRWRRAASRRGSRDELDFSPAALAVLERPASPIGRALLWVLMAFSALAMAWAMIGRLDIVAVAEGKVIPSGQSKVLQAADAGSVSMIRVEDGQRVRQGAVLLVLDTVASAADLEKVRASREDAALTIAQAQALLRAVTDGRMPMVQPVDGVASARLFDAGQLAASRFAELRVHLAQQRWELLRRERELVTARQKAAALATSAPIAQAVADDLEPLARDQYVSRHAYQEKRLAALAQGQELAAQRGLAGELEAAVAQQRATVDATTADFQRAQMEALRQAQEQLRQSEAEERKLAQRVSQATLVAPVDGTVQQLAVHTVGGVVTAAQPLLVIVPDHAGLEVEAQVLNRDVGFVRAGQRAAIKLEAFPYTHYGYLEGTVRSLSRDAVKDDKRGLIYPARIALAQTAIMADGAAVQLTPGMAVSVEVSTGERSIIDFLLAPLARYRHEAMRER